MFEKNSVLTLSDDNEYVVADKYEENGTTYVYLVDLKNNANTIFSRLEKDEIIELTDPDELEKVISEVNKHLHEQFK